MKKTYLGFDENESVFNNQLRMQVYSAAFANILGHTPWLPCDEVHRTALRVADGAVEANNHAKLLAHMPHELDDDQEPPLL